MFNKINPGQRDWLTQVNKMFEDYSNFSQNWDNKRPVTDNVRWGSGAISDIIGINGCKVNSAGVQRYTWNGQPVNFLVYDINVPMIRNVTSTELLKLPFHYNLIIGNIQDAIGSTGYLRLQGSGTDKIGFANDSGVDIQGSAIGSAILL